MQTPLVKRGPHPNTVFLLEPVVEPLEVCLGLSICTDLDELDADLEAQVRSATNWRAQSTYLGKDRTRIVQSPSDADDGALKVVSCWLHVSFA